LRAGWRLPGGFGELLERVRSGVEIGVWVVKCSGELVEGSVQELPGDDGESWAVALELPGGPPVWIDAVWSGDEPRVVSVA